MVALTFDDGPGKRTMELLEFLEDNNAKATFFMLGQNVSRYEDTLKKMVEKLQRWADKIDVDERVARRKAQQDISNSDEDISDMGNNDTSQNDNGGVLL